MLDASPSGRRTDHASRRHRRAGRCERIEAGGRSRRPQAGLRELVVELLDDLDRARELAGESGVLRCEHRRRPSGLEPREDRRVPAGTRERTFRAEAPQPPSSCGPRSDRTAADSSRRCGLSRTDCPFSIDGSRMRGTNSILGLVEVLLDEPADLRRRRRMLAAKLLRELREPRGRPVGARRGRGPRHRPGASSSVRMKRSVAST